VVGRQSWDLSGRCRLCQLAKVIRIPCARRDYNLRVVQWFNESSTTGWAVHSLVRAFQRLIDFGGALMPLRIFRLGALKNAFQKVTRHSMVAQQRDHRMLEGDYSQFLGCNVSSFTQLVWPGRQWGIGQRFPFAVEARAAHYEPIHNLLRFHYLRRRRCWGSWGNVD
jgi:hypothetical protein